MAVSDNTIMSPENLRADLMTLLGETNPSVKVLCASAKINMFARWKPEPIGGSDPITLDQRKDNNFSIYPTATYNSRLDFINAVKAGTFTGGWGYNRVLMSNASHAGRMGDFLSYPTRTAQGYWHKATSPFGALLPFKATLTADTNNKTVIPLDAPDTSDPRLLNLADFRKSGASYKDWYLGVLLYHSSRYFIATATSPIGTLQDWQVSFGHLDPSYAATYKGVPFLSSKPYTVNGTEQAGTQIIGIGNPGVNIELVKITAQYKFLLTCIFTGDTNTISYELKITNASTASRSFAAVTLYAASSSAGAGSVQIVSLGTITVAAGATVTKTGTKALTAPSGYASNYYLWCRVTFTGAAAADQTWVPIDQYDPGDDAG